MNNTERDQLSDIACDHGDNPRNRGALAPFDGHARISGPCGDSMEFWIVVEQGKVIRVGFDTDGCLSSLACGSMATTLAADRKLEEVEAMGQGDILEALGGMPRESEHCALLAADALSAACKNYRELLVKSKIEDREKLMSRLGRIRRRIIVLSGKGGVGKSTVAVNLATALSMSGQRVGLLDVDIHGPSVPTMLGLEQKQIGKGENGMLPVKLGRMKVMSIGFLLRDPDDAVIWRGPMKYGIIRQFLKDVVWGDLDYLIIDAPPGTGDEPLSVCQLVGDLDGAVVVTTPQKVAAVDVRKSITFCRKLHVPVLGVVENMSGFVCPHCGETTSILQAGAGLRISESMGVPFLGSIPIDPQIAAACDSGKPFVRMYAYTASAEAMRKIIQPIEALNQGQSHDDAPGQPVERRATV